MNKTILLILSTVFIIICIISGIAINVKSQKQQVISQNKDYENYCNKEIPGTDLATLIGKVVNENEKNNVQKDEKGYYIENEEDSIKIDLKMKTIEKTYPMEEIYNNKVTNFVQYFSTISFKCIRNRVSSKNRKSCKNGI